MQQKTERIDSDQQTFYSLLLPLRKYGDNLVPSKIWYGAGGENHGEGPHTAASRPDLTGARALF